MSMPPPCTAFLIAFGPEVRAFLHSGFIEECAGEGRVIIVTSHPESLAFQNVDWPVIALPDITESERLARFRWFASRVVEKRLERDGYSKWRHYLPEKETVKERFRFLKSSLTSRSGIRLIDTCESLLEKACGSNGAFAEIFREHGISTLYYSAYGNPRTNATIVAAKSLGIQTVAIPNSWKDFFTRPRISPRPDVLWVFEDMCRTNYLRHNPGLSMEQVLVKSSLHLKAIRKHSGRMTRGDFCQLYGFDPKRPIACYTTAAPNAVIGEERIVEALARSLSENSPCQFLVRVNPMETSSRFEETLSGIPGVAIQRPKWEWQPKNDWCCALEADTTLWAATLEHMTVNISVPSTVTLEAQFFSRPVINIGFDNEIDLPMQISVRRFWNAPFYRCFHGDPKVFLAGSSAQLVKLVRRSLMTPAESFVT